MTDSAFAMAQLALWAQGHGIHEIRTALAFAGAAATEVSDSDGLVNALVTEKERILASPAQVFEPAPTQKEATTQAGQTAKETKPEKEKP